MYVREGMCDRGVGHVALPSSIMASYIDITTDGCLGAFLRACSGRVNDLDHLPL